MTRQEILNTPEIVDFMIDKSVMVDSKIKLHKRLEELCKLAIKALEQQPCEDCISREALRNLKVSVPIAPIFIGDNYIRYRDVIIYDEIIDLPSVTPTNPSTTPSVGVWIDQGLYADNSSAHDFMCSVCGNHEIEVEMDHFKYCPVCGARLEVEE